MLQMLFKLLQTGGGVPFSLIIIALNTLKAPISLQAPMALKALMALNALMSLKASMDFKAPEGLHDLFGLYWPECPQGPWNRFCVIALRAPLALQAPIALKVRIAVKVLIVLEAPMALRSPRDLESPWLKDSSCPKKLFLNSGMSIFEPLKGLCESLVGPFTGR